MHTFKALLLPFLWCLVLIFNVHLSLASSEPSTVHVKGAKRPFVYEYFVSQVNRLPSIHKPRLPSAVDANADTVQSTNHSPPFAQTHIGDDENSTSSSERVATTIVSTISSSMDGRNDVKADESVQEEGETDIRAVAASKMFEQNKAQIALVVGAAGMILVL